MKNIELSFLGKDSVPYKRVIQLPDEVYAVLEKTMNNRPADEQIFVNANSHDVASFLSEVQKGISPKVLRTAKCNQTLVDNLRKLTPKNVSNLSDNDKLKIIYRANLEIAKTLNHQKNVAKNQKEQEAKAADRVDACKKKIDDATVKQEEKMAKLLLEEKKLHELYAKMPKILKEKLAEIAVKKEKLEAQMLKKKEAAKKAEFLLMKRKETKDINLSTSLANYADPKLVAAWCNKIDLPLNKVYNKAMLEKFDEAVDTPASYFDSF